MIELDANFNPGRTLRDQEMVVINGERFRFQSSVRVESLLKVIVATFDNAQKRITVEYRPYKGLWFSEEIDRDVYFDTVTGWKIRD